MPMHLFVKLFKIWFRVRGVGWYSFEKFSFKLSVLNYVAKSLFNLCSQFQLYVHMLKKWVVRAQWDYIRQATVPHNDRFIL
jgi:hypothetical protein